MNSLYCLHPVVMYDEVFNGSVGFLFAQQYFGVFYYIYIIIITINDFLVRVAPV